MGVTELLDLLSWALILVGVGFMLTGTFGVLRFPDVFTRQHAAGMTDTAGAGFIVLGLMVQSGFGLNLARLLFILLFLVFTSPIATHAVCRAALHAGEKPVTGPHPGKK